MNRGEPIINKTYLKYILEYIEHHLYDNHPAQNLPAIANYSLMQLYRDFYSLTGHSLNEYIRKRRLSNALALLKHSSMSIADIAYHCGYSSQQNFTKAVKKDILIPPTEYKKSDTYFYFPAYNIEHARQIVVKSETIPEVICIRFYYHKLIDIENEALAYLFDLIPDFNGRIFGRQGKQKGTKFCYELFITEAEQYHDILAASDFCDIHLLPSYSHLFAMITTPNIESEINSSWNYIYEHWLKSSMFIKSDILYFEEYIKAGTKINKLKLFLPIEKRNELLNIHIETLHEKAYIAVKKDGYFADEAAANVLVNYIRDNPDFLKKESYEFLVLKNKNNYICAIPAEDKLLNEFMESLVIQSGVYAVLECECCNDYSIYEAILTSFVSETGFELDEFPVFAIYETDSDFDHIDLKLYCKLKDVKSGKD